MTKMLFKRGARNNMRYLQQVKLSKKERPIAFNRANLIINGKKLTLPIVTLIPLQKI